MKHRWIFLMLVVLAACREADAPLSPSGGTGYLHIASDPAGASIFIDGQDRHKVTPDTVHGVYGRHTLQVQLDSAGNRYSYSVQLDLNRDSIVNIDGPLMLGRCADGCGSNDLHTPHRMRFSRSAAGPLFYSNSNNRGLVWPWSSGNSYAANGLPVFGAELGTAPVSLGVYDLAYLVGRPFPRTSVGSDWFSLRQSFWVLPPQSLLPLATVRGLEVQEEVIGRSSTNDVLIVRVTFRNVSNLASYQSTDPYMPAGGMRMNRAYLGFALDADVGEPGDDLFTYVPELDALVMYDARFSENGFTQSYNVSPGMVGLRLLDAPAGAKRILNGWPSTISGGGNADWSAGTAGEAAGYEVLAGRLSHAPNHSSETIGHLPGANAADYRIAVSAGPVDLAPGDSASITVAIAIAEPVTGFFSSGTLVESGEPLTADRPITRIAAAVLDKLRAATGVR